MGKRNETALIKSTKERLLTAKGYKFINRCVLVMAENKGYSKYHAEVKKERIALKKIITHLIIDKGCNLDEIKGMIKNSIQ